MHCSSKQDHRDLTERHSIRRGSAILNNIAACVELELRTEESEVGLASPALEKLRKHKGLTSPRTRINQLPYPHRLFFFDHDLQVFRRPYLAPTQCHRRPSQRFEPTRPRRRRTEATLPGANQTVPSRRLDLALDCRGWHPLALRLRSFRKLTSSSCSLVLTVIQDDVGGTVSNMSGTCPCAYVPVSDVEVASR